MSSLRKSKRSHGQREAREERNKKTKGSRLVHRKAAAGLLDKVVKFASGIKRPISGESRILDTGRSQ